MYTLILPSKQKPHLPISTPVRTSSVLSSPSTHATSAFTIVELLIVIVVIAILAVVGIVAYRGIQNRAVETTLKSDLRSAIGEVGRYKALAGSYPSTDSPDEHWNGFSPSQDNDIQYTSDGTDYCITARSAKPGIPTLMVTNQNQTAIEGHCPDHEGVASPPTSAGASWTGHALPPLALRSWTSITYGDGLFVGVSGDTGIITSPDGVDWTSIPSPSTYTGWNSVAYGNDRFVAVGGHSTFPLRFMTSTNGADWTASSISQSDSVWSGVAYGNGQFVAVSSGSNWPSNSNPDAARSTNGTTWNTRRVSPSSVHPRWNSVAYGNGRFVAVGGDGANRVMISDDGVNWTMHPAAEQNYWSSVTYGNGRFVAVSRWGDHQIMTSTNGVDWTPVAAPAGVQLYSITFGGGRFVAVSSAGVNRVITSTDGTNWVGHLMPENKQWGAVTYGNGCFVALTTGSNPPLAARSCE